MIDVRTFLAVHFDRDIVPVQIAPIIGFENDSRSMTPHQ